MASIEDLKGLAATFQHSTKGVVYEGIVGSNPTETKAYLKLIGYLAGVATDKSTLAEPLINAELQQALTAIINQTSEAETNQRARLAQLAEILQQYIDSEDTNPITKWAKPAAAHLLLELQSLLANPAANDELKLLARFEGNKGTTEVVRGPGGKKELKVDFHFTLGDGFDEKETPKYLDTLRRLAAPITIGGQIIPPFIAEQDLEGLLAYISGNGLIDPNLDAIAIYLKDVLERVIASPAYQQSPIDQGAAILHLHREILARLTAQGLAFHPPSTETRVSAEEVDVQLSLAREVMEQGDALPNNYYHSYQNWRFDPVQLEQRMPGRGQQIVDLLLASGLIISKGDGYILKPGFKLPDDREIFYTKWQAPHVFTRQDFAEFGDRAGLALAYLQRELGYLDPAGKAVASLPSKRIYVTHFSAEEIGRLKEIVKENRTEHFVSQAEASIIYDVMRFAYASESIDRTTRVIGHYTLSKVLLTAEINF